MNRKTLFTRAAALAGALACMTAASAETFPALRVSKGGHSVVLIGSQHSGVAQPGRRQAVETLVARSTGVCLEADPRDPATANAGARLMTNPPGVRLRDRLSPATYEAAQRHTAFLPPAARNIDGLSPFALSTLLAFNVPELREKLVAMKATTSLDADIVYAAQRLHKPIVAIEKPDALSASLARLSDKEWDAYIAGIMKILDCKECVAAYGANMVMAHALTSDYEDVNRSIGRAFGSRSDLSTTYDRIYFDKRNVEMARAIEHDAIDAGRCSLVAVGIGHLGGDHGVVALLRRGGLQVAPATAVGR